MFMKKFMKLILIFFLVSLLIFCNFCSIFFKFDFYHYKKFFNSMNFTIGLNMENFILIFMIIFVTMFVVIFSEIYLESYNTKNFFLFMFLFFFSMIILIFSSSNMSFILSWDMLGLSSMLLIKFYPNEISFYNSIFTMIFNRLGDFFLLISMILICSKSLNFIFFMDELTLLMFMIFCIMTKSAQFPMSTWLPMAMSAPTPISAMVHSSTLVTVGLIIFYKYNDLFFFSNFYFIFYLISSLTFIVGGLMSCYELDFKKIVAFSTMSQISMIMFMISFNFKILSILHMLLHAYFKSFLFGCTGMFFFFFFMNQNKFIITNKSFNKKLCLFMFFNLYMMSGFTYSMSFFSKDFLLEWTYSNFNLTNLFLIMLIGTFFTITYCKFLMNSTMNFFIMNSNFYNKSDNSLFNIYYIYSFFFLFMMMFIFMSFFNYFFFSDLMLLNLFLILVIFTFFKNMVGMYYMIYNNMFFNYYLMIFYFLYQSFYNLTMDQEFFFKYFYLFNFNYNMIKSKFYNF